MCICIKTNKQDKLKNNCQKQIQRKINFDKYNSLISYDGMKIFEYKIYIPHPPLEVCLQSPVSAAQ